jgi:hypothetical protein
MRQTPLVSKPKDKKKVVTFKEPEEESLFIPKQYEEEEEEKQKTEIMSKQVELTKNLAVKLRNQCHTYQLQVDAYNTKLTNLKFEYERIQAKRMTSWWYLVLIALTFLKYHSYTHRSIFGLILCEIAFYYNFRLLYVAKSPHATTIGWMVVFIVLFLV